MNSKSLQTGFLLKGNSYSYKIERVLGQGSFGITYLASVKMGGALGSIDVNIKVAIKEFFMRDINGRCDAIVTSGSKGGIYDDYRRKFAREALNLSKLQHPNIIKVIESFEANNTIYYVMEFIAGGSLDDYIAKNNGIKEDEAIKIVKQIGSALSFMHKNKMLHLDLKPSNIMMKESGDIVLIDFGLSKQYDPNGDPESSTKVGAGTPGYAPIEQANYKQDGSFPTTLDVYALGATFFKMLSGNKPQYASEVLEEGLDIVALTNKGVSRLTIDAVQKAMAPIKKNRFQTITEFLSSLNISVSSSHNKTKSKTNDYHGFSTNITNEETDVTFIEDNYHKSNQDENDLRQLVDRLIESDEYKEAYKMCMQYIKDNRCKSVAHELSQKLVPLMKKQNRKQNRKQIIIVTVVTIIVMILSILLNS